MKHNKKRNVGLIFEFLSRFLAERTLNGDHASIQKVKKIISKNFHKESSLRKELLLFQALFNSKFDNAVSAQRFLESIKEKNSKLSSEELDKEKTLLLQEVNISFPSCIKVLFEAEIPDYKDYATIQMLLSEWRTSSVLTEAVTNNDLAILEDRVLTKLLESTANKTKSNTLAVVKEFDNGQEDVNTKLVLHFMAKEINQKYGQELNESQLQIINLFSSNKQEELAVKLSEVHSKVSKLLKETAEKNTSSKTLKEKCETLKVQMNENVSKLNEEELVLFYLELTELEKDLTTK